MLKLTKRVMLIAFLAAAALTGCEKKELEQSQEDSPQKSNVITQAEIDILRGVFAKLVNVDVSEITYNEKSQSFMMFGVDQISLKNLKEYYERSK